MDYKDTRTNKRVGPTLLHTAITNRPYVTELDGFEEIIAASAPGADNIQTVVLTSATPIQEEAMTYAEWVAQGKAEFQTDVEALKLSAAQSVQLSNAVRDNLTEHGLIQLSAGEDASPADAIAAVKGAGEKIVELSGTIDTMRTEALRLSADSEVQELVDAGRVLPKDKESYVELKLSNPDLFDKIVPEKPLVELSREAGVEGDDDASKKKTVDDELTRLSKVAKRAGIPILVADD
jgi:hypothetical protein